MPEQPFQTAADVRFHFQKSASGADASADYPRLTLTEFLRGVGEAYTHVFFGDTHHENNGAIRNFVADPRVLDTLAATGKKHFVDELPADRQGLVDSLQKPAGEGQAIHDLKRATFLIDITFEHLPLQQHRDGSTDGYYWDKTADIIETADRNGMKAHWIDTRHSGKHEHPYQKIGTDEFYEEVDKDGVLSDLRWAWRRHVLVSPETWFADEKESSMQGLEFGIGWRKENPDRAEKLELSVNKATMKAMFDDRSWKTLIDGRIPPGEGIVGYVGNGHLNDFARQRLIGETMKNGIDDLLGGDARVASIALYPNRAIYEQQITESGWVGPDQPQYQIVLDEGLVIGRNGEQFVIADMPQYVPPPPDPAPGATGTPAARKDIPTASR